MTDYTPNTNEVREAWVWQRYEEGYFGPCPNDPAEFNRWLAEHDAEVSEKRAEGVYRIYAWHHGDWELVGSAKTYDDARNMGDDWIATAKAEAVRVDFTVYQWGTPVPVSETRKEQI